MFAIAAIWTAVFFGAAALSPDMPTGIAQEPGSVPKLPALQASTFALAGLAVLLTLLCVIRLEYNHRRLLVAHFYRQAGRPQSGALNFDPVVTAS